MLISPEYARQNAELHERYEGYGVKSAKWLGEVRAFCGLLGARSVIDYGCGKGSLVKALRDEGFEATGYDPALPEWARRPNPADIVACTDVLEHIEPECLDDVLADIHGLGKLGYFFIVATRPAEKTLLDGRNAHLIVEHSNWWLKKLLERFRLVGFRDHGKGFVAVCGR